MTASVVVTSGSAPQVVVQLHPSPTVSAVSPSTPSSTSSSTQTVNVQELGIVGPTGPMGPSGGTPDEYQLTDASSWSLVHEFAYPPEVRVLDDQGVEVWMTVSYPAPNVLHLQFPEPFTGKVLLS